MNTSHTTEILRVRTQRELDDTKTHAERNRLGQFATPPQLALAILQESRKYFGNGNKVRFLDPAFGTGAFYSALLQVFPSKQIQSVMGFEIDPHYGVQAHRLWAHSALKLQVTDFFTVPLPANDDGRANFIVCNPPYVRHHHLSVLQKERMGKSIARSVGLKINGLSGLYCYFLIHTHNWLAHEGIGCWLVPTEFMGVNYGAVVKDYLLRKVTLLRIHRFDPNESQFEDALVSSAVVWFKKMVPTSDHRVELTFGGNLEDPHVVRHVSSAELARAPKWTRLTNSEPEEREGLGVKLSDLFEVKRGLATGDNNFFILNKEDIERHNLPHRFLIPILPSPRYLRQSVVQADKEGNPLVERELFLLSCHLPPHEVRKEYGALWRYLESGKEKKIHERYLSRHRSPWYVQEKRPASPFLCTYMGRRNSQKGSPFRFILNRSKATAANVYLFLYPKPPLAALIAKQPAMVKKIWEALKDISPESLMNEGRVYGGGLHKMEPRELANTSAETILQSIPELRSRLGFSEKVSPLQEILL